MSRGYLVFFAFFSDFLMIPLKLPRIRFPAFLFFIEGLSDIARKIDPGQF